MRSWLSGRFGRRRDSNACIPVRQTAIGEFSVARGQRFAPFYAGDTLVNDVPYALGVPMGGRPTLQRYPAMEIPMVFPELLEAKLGIEDASRIRCTAHLWAAPQRELPYAVSVRDCPEFFRSVVSQAYEDARVESPDTPTHYVESVVFSFDEAKETWDIRRE